MANLWNDLFHLRFCYQYLWHKPELSMQTSIITFGRLLIEWYWRYSGLESWV